MRILLVHPHIFAGGAEKAIVYLGQNLRQMGHEVSIATLSTDHSKLPNVYQDLDYIKPEVEVPPSNDETLSGTISRVVKEANGLRELLKNIWRDFDVCIPGNFPAYWSTYQLRKHMPIVWLCSEVLGPYGVTKDSYDKGRIFRAAFKAASIIDKQIVERSVHEIVACSDLCRVMIKERYKRDAHVAYTAVDYNYFSQGITSAEAKKKLGLDDNYVLLHVGFMIKRKNQSLSLQAVKRLIEDMPDLKLVFVGEGPHGALLREEVKCLGVDEHVIFMGLVDEEMLKTVYYACDIHLYPMEDQTFGLGPFEALACGKASIVSGCSGATHLLKSIDAAIIIDPVVEEIAEAIRCVRERKIDLEGMVERGKQFVSESLTWKAYGKTINDILEKVHDQF